MAKIGLLAGYGKLPILFSQAAKDKGDTVVAFGLKGVTSEGLADHVEKIHWLEWGQFQKALFLLATEKLKKVVMLGKIRKDILFKGDEGLDDKTKAILEKTKDRKDYSILKQASKALSVLGIEVGDPTEYLRHLLPSKGALTKREPSPDEWEDIHYGVEVAKDLSRFDIGQTVAVKDKTVIALEAVEGTDDTIKRAGKLSKMGFSVIKVARPDQDMRFDIPMTGSDTIKVLIASGGKAIALEAGKTLLLDKEEMISLADDAGVSVVVI